MWKFAIVAAVATMILASGQASPDGCGICRKEECPLAADCRAGLVLDRCGCCSVCGRLEGEKCDNYTLPLPQKDLYGFCGDNMACLLRKDLEDMVCIFIYYYICIHSHSRLLITYIWALITFVALHPIPTKSHGRISLFQYIEFLFNNYYPTIVIRPTSSFFLLPHQW